MYLHCLQHRFAVIEEKPCSYQDPARIGSRSRTSVNVAAGTVRISDMAFAGAPVRQVILPYTLKSVGHKAFYQCEKLVMMTFTSYVAPVLEEAFDAMIFLDKQHIPATGTFSFYMGVEAVETEVEGLGIVPYFIWNCTETPSNVYYGANFVDYIGYAEGDLVMVRPVNGKQYDSFIMGQYFATVVDGAAAADDVTLAAIAAIDALPETVSLADKPLVIAAREAYNKISTIEQRALVTNYAKLEKAEKRIQDLEYLENGQETETETETETGNGFFESLPVSVIATGAVSALLLIAASVFASLYLSKRKALAAATAPAAETEAPAEEAMETKAPAEEVAETAEAETPADTTPADEGDTTDVQE